MRRRLKVSIVLLACIALTGCSPTNQSEEEAMTVDNVSSRGNDLYAAVRAVVGEGAWSTDEKWLSCGVTDGQARVQLRLDSRLAADIPGRPQDLIELVRERWLALGVDAAPAVNSDLDPVRYILSDPPFLQGVKQDGSTSSLWLGTGIANFGYVSPCIPGDVFLLNGVTRSSFSHTSSGTTH